MEDPTYPLDDPKASKRENLMRWLKHVFEEQRAGTNGMTQTWDVVSRSPLTKEEMRRGTAIAIFDTAERKESRISGGSGAPVDAHLMVQAEFYLVTQIGDNAGSELNRLLLDVQRTFMGDVTLGGRAINVVEARSELDVDGPADRLVAGMVEFSIHYRHRRDDARQ